jgi:hypothetical protein
MINKPLSSLVKKYPPKLRFVVSICKYLSHLYNFLILNEKNKFYRNERSARSGNIEKQALRPRINNLLNKLLHK